MRVHHGAVLVFTIDTPHVYDYNSPSTSKMTSTEDIDWSDFDEPEIISKIGGFKSAMTKGSKNITSLSTRNTARPSAHTVAEISRELQAYLRRAEIVQTAYAHLLSEAKSDADKKKYEKGLDDNDSVKNAIRDLALDAMEAEKAPPPSAHVPTNPDGSVRDFKKTNEGLKPTTLSHEDSPEQLRSWQRMWMSFYATGNLHTLRVEDQQAWLLSVVDKCLAGRFESRMKSDTPIFKDALDPNVTSCLGIVEEEFLRRYPLAARRHQFFTYTPTKGTPMCQVDDTLSNMAKNADIARMTEDELLALRIVTACLDEGLKREFLKLRIMSLDNVRHTYESWEQQQNTMSLLTPSYAQAVSANSAQPGRQRPQRNKSKPAPKPPQQKFPTPNQDKQRLKLSGLCLRCAGRDHDSFSCPHRSNLTCSTCKKTGHVPAVCFAAARAADAAAAAGGARSVQATDELEQLHAAQAQQNQLSQQTPAPLAIQFDGQANAVRAYGMSGPNRPTPPLNL